MNSTTSGATATRIAAIHVLVKDLDRARSFYRDALGLRVDAEHPNAVTFKLDDGFEFGIAYMSDMFMPGGGMIFNVADVRAATARLKELGLTVYEDSHAEGNTITTWASDTEGNYFALRQVR